MRKHWPATLDEVLAEPVEPRCPQACCFRELCPTHVQAGTVQLLEAHRIQGPSECTWFEVMERKVHEELGPDPLPADASGLRERLRLLRGTA